MPAAPARSSPRSGDRLIHESTEGVPRLVNKYADFAMVYAATSETSESIGRDHRRDPARWALPASPGDAEGCRRMMFDLRFYWRMVLRRAPAMIALVILFGRGHRGRAARAHHLPAPRPRCWWKVRKLPKPLGRQHGAHGGDAESIELIRQQVLTRANMLRIARGIRRVRRSRHPDPDDIVDMMRAHTEQCDPAASEPAVEPSPDQIAFEARTGEIAANVVNEYVTQIVNANVELRTGTGRGHAGFL
jgi:hypothetical protein